MIFDELRKQNADSYTQHPLLSMPEEDVRKLATQTGFDDLEAFKMFCFQPSEEMTCPLCGRPQNHLSDCKGCGTGAFTNWDFEEAYGERAAITLRERLQTVLEGKYDTQIAEYAANHSYDCMVCTECWQATIQTPDTFRSCPLRLLSNRTLTGNLADTLLMAGNFWAMNRDDMATSLQQWQRSLWTQWVSSVSETVAAWRTTLLNAALDPQPQPGDKPRATVSERVQECLDYLDLDDTEQQ